MHEFHLMTQVVKAVEAGLRGAAQAKPVLVRLKVRASSHLLERDPSALHTAFALAARGTRAEGAVLDLVPFSGEAWCVRCQAEVPAIGADGVCGTCGDPVLTGEALPEMVVHDVVVEE